MRAYARTYACVPLHAFVACACPDVAAGEKELKLFNSNFSAVGTQAAIMAGFTLTSFVEIDLPPEKVIAKKALHFFVTTSICVNFLTVAMVTFVTVWGGGKAMP